jgi:serine protease Do
MNMDEEKDIENALRTYSERIQFKQRLARIQASADVSAYPIETEQSGQIRALWRTYR